uniref:Uncharacterized protein n=1 Tax=Arundo donax TaxID=35708 RepID=A0A0A8YLX2_ARUDO
MFSIPVGLWKHGILNPAFFMFLRFSYPVFQRSPYWVTSHMHMYTTIQANMLDKLC